MTVYSAPYAPRHRQTSDTIREGECAWHKETHLLLLVQRAPSRPRRHGALKFKRLAAFDTREGKWWPTYRLRSDLFVISPMTVFIPKKRFEVIRRRAGAPARPSE